MICPCKSSVKYIECCGLIHKSIFNAKTAEQLMRSRYSAFVLNKMEYLRLSHAKSTVNTFNFHNTSKWIKSVNWVCLEIKNIKDGSESCTIGFVEFKAYFKEHGILEFIHGKSRFIKENSHWVYLDEL